MGWAPPRPCARCGTIARGRCPRCAGAVDRGRGTSAQRLYTARWSRAATRFKARYPLCGMRTHQQPPVMSECFDRHILTPAYQVDHVVPHQGDLALFWDENNWQSLCASCGSRKTRAGL